MKPDGVATAALEPMETLDSNPVNEAAPAAVQEANQAASPVEPEAPQPQPEAETVEADPQPDPAKDGPAAMTGDKTSGDPKAKTPNKAATTKTKTGTPAKTTTASRPSTNQSRSNGVSKTTSNGMTKKPSPDGAKKPSPNGAKKPSPDGAKKPSPNGAKKPSPDGTKKSTTTAAPAKKPAGTTSVPATKTKVGEKKATGAAPTNSNGGKSMTGTTAAKRSPPTTANGDKTSSTAAAAAKKAPAPKPASVAPTKPSSTASPKPPVSKTTRPAAAPAPSSRPATSAARPPATTTTKSSTATAKPATPKTSTTTSTTAAKPAAAAKPTSTTTTPSAGKAPASQTAKNITPVKKDVTKTAPSTSKKPESPLTRPSATAKPAKPETPKSAPKPDVMAKKPPAAKAVDTKTPTRPKTDSKPAPFKTPVSKTAAAKTSTPKKTVGSSTPTPVKRGPKAEPAAEPTAEPAAESEKEIAAAVAAAAAIATAAAVIAGPEEPEPAVEPELMSSQTAAVQEKTPEPEPVLVREPTPEALREPTPEAVQELTPEPLREPTPKPVREPTPEAVREPTPEPLREPTPEALREPTPEAVRELTPEPLREPTPKPVREPTPEPVKEPTPEPVWELTPKPAREPTPEPAKELTPEPEWEPTAEPVREPSPVQVREPSPEPLPEPLSLSESDQGAEAAAQLSAQLDLFKFEDSANDSVPSLGTTVMSPPCSPPGPVSPVREPQNAASLLDMQVQSDPWDQNQTPRSMMDFQMEEEEKENTEQFEALKSREEEEEEEEEKENLFTSAGAFSMAAQPHLLGTSPVDHFPSRDLMSPQEKEEAVEKADEEINEDDEEEEEDDYDDEEQRRLGHQPSSLTTDVSMSQPSEDFQTRSSAFGGSGGWHGDDPLSGMDSEDVSSCTSSRQQGVSDLSSTQHTAILEGTQSSDALIDSSLRGSEGDGNLMSSPNVETLANEEEDDEDEEDERVDDMDLSSERVEEHHKVFQQQEEEEEEDEDVEMRSEGVTESCGNVDEDDFNEEERLDNLNRSPAPPPCVPPPASSWGQTNPFCDSWAQPASLLAVSSPSPLSDHGAADSETPMLSPAKARLDGGSPSFAPQSGMKSSAEEKEEEEEEENLFASPAPEGVSQPGAAHSNSETSTPEELRDYDSSSGVESRSDKQQTPVPASLQPDLEQDLGIHLEKGDGEEEEAETLPADEVLGTGPPTAPASAPSSPSTSGDEASDTEGEMQINDPDAPVTMDESAGFESPPPTCNLPALEEDEEAGDAAAIEGEEDGGGTTPQSANSVASYGFDCTTSNSNAHSMAESCGKSPGIFSLENEEQLPEEAKDPSLIMELTLPPSAAAAAHADDLLGRPVDLMPLAGGLDEQHYALEGKLAAELLEEVDPLEPGTADEDDDDDDDSQPPYYSTICDKTDSFLAGDSKTHEADEDQEHSQEDNWNQNHTTTIPIANGHYLALVPGNRRPIDPTVAAHFSKVAPPPPLPLIEAAGGVDGRAGGGEQLRRLEQHQEKLREMQHRQEQERQKRQWLEEERLRLEQQKQLEKQRRELLQLQLQQQQQEHRHRRQVLQWQLELEQQYRMQQKQIQQQQQLRRSPTGVMLSPSSGLCTIYEAMETSDEEDEARGEQQNRNGGKRLPASRSVPQDFHRQLRPVPPQELEWNKKVDMVQQLINQTLMLSGDRSCPPLLLLPVGTGGTLSPLESSMWPDLLPQHSPPAATVTSVSSYSPDSQGSSPPGDWTVVEVETQH